MAHKTHTFTDRQKMGRNTFEVYHYRNENVKEVSLHHHDFYEIYYFVSGNVSYNIESRSYRLSPGDVLLINPQELHQPVFSPEKQHYERYVLWISESFLQQFILPGQDMSRCFDTDQPDHTNLIRPDGVTRELLTYLFQQLIREQESREFASDLCCLSLLAQLLVMVNRIALRAGRAPEPRENADSVVYRILSYIGEHYSEDLSLDFLANEFFLSKYHLSREFSRVVGTSIHRYIVQQRQKGNRCVQKCCNGNADEQDAAAGAAQMVSRCQNHQSRTKSAAKSADGQPASGFGRKGEQQDHCQTGAGIDADDIGAGQIVGRDGLQQHTCAGQSHACQQPRQHPGQPDTQQYGPGHTLPRRQFRKGKRGTAKAKPRRHCQHQQRQQNEVNSPQLHKISPYRSSIRYA